MADVASRPVDAGRVLRCCYALFVVAAGARSIVQLATHADRAPVAYALSALAAACYAAGFFVLRGPSASVARSCLIVELCGVVVVGTLSVLRPALFPDPTVWSYYGAGYLFVPLLLPAAGLWWLRSHRDQ